MSLKKSFAKVMNRIGGPVPSLEKELMAAIDADDAAEVEALLQLSPSLISEQNSSAPGAGNGPDTEMLSYALQSRKNAAAKALVKMVPGLVTSTDSNGMDLMMRLLRAPASSETIKAAAEIFVNQMPRATDKHGNTYLHYAAGAESNDAKSVELTAFYYRGRIDTANDEGETPLMRAAKSGTPDAAKILLGEGADIFKEDKKGIEPPMHAIRHSNLATATYLMQQGGTVDFSDPAIETQRRVASVELNLDFLKALEEVKKKQEGNKRIAELVEKNRRKAQASATVAQIPQVVQKGTRSMKAPRTARFSRTPTA